MTIGVHRTYLNKKLWLYEYTIRVTGDLPWCPATKPEGCGDAGTAAANGGRRGISLIAWAPWGCKPKPVTGDPAMDCEANDCVGGAWSKLWGGALCGRFLFRCDPRFRCCSLCRWGLLKLGGGPNDGPPALNPWVDCICADSGMLAAAGSGLMWLLMNSITSLAIWFPRRFPCIS